MPQVTDDLVKRYRTVTPLLQKIEEAVIGTNTGRAPLLLPYYAHWERAVFRAVNALALNGLLTLVKQLSAHSGAPADQNVAPHALFKVRHRPGAAPGSYHAYPYRGKAGRQTTSCMTAAHSLRG